MQQEVHLDGVALENGVTLREYLQRLGKPASAYTRGQLAHSGVVATVSMTAVGLEGKELLLNWTLIDDASKKQVPDYRDQPAARIREGGLKSGGDDIWVPAPPQPGLYWVLFELRALNGSLIDKKLSDRPFRVA